MVGKRRKLDNAALAFPAAAGRKDSRVFRLSCFLREEVDREVLQRAAERSVKKFPLFQSVLKEGAFWFYFEESGICQKVENEGYPCLGLYEKGKQNLLYQVSCGKNTIHLEVFHALSDGTGAFQFLVSIVEGYLEEIHGVNPSAEKNPCREEQEEDSFSRFYSSGKEPVKARKSRRAYQMTGKRLDQAHMSIQEYTIPTDLILKVSRSYQVSVTVYLASVLMKAIDSSYRGNRGKCPVTLMIPINLRNYYPSKTMTNFWSWMEIEYAFNDHTEFREILEHVKERFSMDLQKDQVALRMNKYIRLEKNRFLQYVPLGIKNFFLKLGAWLGGGSVTAVFSNVGEIHLPEQYLPYIERFGAIASTDKIQMCSCSFGDRFYFSITSKFEDDAVQRNLLKILQDEGICVEKLERYF